MHQKLLSTGVNSFLEIGSGLFHVWHLFWPVLKEGRDALSQAGKFIMNYSESKREFNL